MSVGLLYFELDLDTTKFVKQQEALNKQIKNVAQNTNEALQLGYQNLGVKADAFYQLQANLAIKSYERITQASKQSADEQFRAQSAMVAKINSINAEMTKNPLYEQMGIRSMAAINAQKDAVMRSYEVTKAAATGNAAEIVRIERAKNEQLKTLNKEMTGDHEMSMASMTRSVLRWYAAYYVVSTLVIAIKDTIMSGVKAIDDMKTSTIAVAAQITTMQGTTGDIVENYRKNIQYAEKLILVLQRIDAESFANLAQIQKMNTMMSLQGTILDVNNGKQIESFTALTNAVAMFTKGQDKEKQASQEIRALFSGQVKEGNTVALMMDQQIRKTGEYKDGLKGLVEEGRKHNDTLERMKPYLVGIITASGDIQNTWQAVSSSLETSWNIIQRRMFAGIYDEMVEAGQSLTRWLRENETALGELNDRISETYRIIKSLYDLLPSGGMSATAGGIIGRLLLGPGGFTMVAGLILINEQLEKINMNVGSLFKKAGAGGTAMQNIIDVLKGDKDWNTGKATFKPGQFGMTEDVNGSWVSSFTSEHKSELNPYVPKIPKGADKEALAAAKKAADEYRKIQEKALQEEMALFDQREKENTKYLEDGIKDRASIEAKALQEEMALFDLREKENSDYLDKMMRDAAKAAEDQIKELLRIADEEAKRPQREADEARKMVTFYQDMIGMEDEYRQAKLVWIGLEAAVKFKGMDDEVLKARWVKEQRLKFEQEIFDDKAKKVQQGLGDMASMFQSLAGMYAKDSAEASRMQEAANAMIILQKAVAVVNAVSAVSAAAAAPFPVGFAAMASMAAAMGSLLGSIGVTFGAGGASAPSAAYGQNTTILGGTNGQGSESISNSWELLEKTYEMENTKLSGIYNEMRELNNNITGIVTSIVRGGITGTPFGAEFGESISSVRSIFETALSWNYLIPVFDKLLLGIPGKLVSGIGEALFGSSKTTPTGSGISITGGGASVRPYTDIVTERKGALLGLIGGGTSYNTVYGDINDDLVNLFSGPNGVYTNLKSVFGELAVGFGTNFASAVNYAFGDVKINLMGLDSEGINKKITEYVSGIADIAVDQLFGSIIKQYQEVGEGLMETATRLVTDKVIVLEALAMTQKEFSGTAEEAIALSESLIALSGDLEALRGYASTYYDKFFSAEEKQVRLHQQLTDAMSDIVVPLSNTRAGYRDIIEALDVTTELGKEAYVTMLALAESADQYYSYLEEAQQKAIDSQKEYVQTLRDISKTIDDWLNNLAISNLAPVQSAAEWDRQYLEYKSKAAVGDATQENVSDYLNYASKYLEFQKSYGTAGSYQDIYNAVVADVTAMEGAKDTALDIAQKQLDALNKIANNTSISATVDAISSMPPKTEGYDTSMIVKIAKGEMDHYSLTPEDAQQMLADSGYQWGTYASGGDHPGGWRMVGERGPELEYTPPSRIFSNPQTKKMLANIDANGGSSESTIHNHIYIDGKEIKYVVTKGLKTDGDMIESVASIARRVN